MIDILPLITVRKGSSLKDKNIRLYKGKPLLVNCIEKCLEVFGKVVVISDSEKYAELAKQSGADVFIDDVVEDLEDVTIRIRKYCKAVDYNGRLVLCQCTSPNILLESYQKTFELSKNLLDDEILMSCVEVTQKPSAFFLQDDNGYLYTAIKGMPIVSKPRQLLEKVFYYNGGITSFHSNQLYKDSLFEEAKLIPLMITEEEILDIDTEDDLRK
jgi:CMP-N-acetylneuraminic acid synthetase